MIPKKLLIFVTLLCFACGGTDYKKYQTPDRKGIAVGKIAVFGGAVDLLRNAPMAVLKPMSEAYVIDDSISAGNLKFVRITWADSSGYVAAGAIMLEGKAAKLIQDVETFTESSLSKKGDTTLTVGSLIAVRQTGDSFAEVVYVKKSGATTAFIPASAITFDLSGNQPQVVASAQTTASDWATPGVEDPAAFETFGDGEWTYPKDGGTDELGEPKFGIYPKYYEGEQSKKNLTNTSFFDGMVNEGDGNHLVEKIKVVFIQQLPGDLTFDIVQTNDEKEPATFTHTFPNAVPDKAYVVTYDNYAGCSEVSIKVTAHGATVEKTLSSDCSKE